MNTFLFWTNMLVRRVTHFWHSETTWYYQNYVKELCQNAIIKP